MTEALGPAGTKNQGTQNAHSEFHLEDSFASFKISLPRVLLQCQSWGPRILSKIKVTGEEGWKQSTA